MIIIITVFRTKDIQTWIRWGKSTWDIKQSMGMLDLKGYKSEKENEYVAISYWNDKKLAEAYMNNKDMKNIFSNTEVISRKIYFPLDLGSDDKEGQSLKQF